MFYTDARESFESRCYLSNMFIVWTIFIFLRCEQSWRKIFYYLSTSLNNFFIWNSFFSIRAIAKIRKQNLKFDLSNIGISASNKFLLGHSRCGMCFVCRILFRKPLLRRLRVYQVAFFIRFFGFFDLFLFFVLLFPWDWPLQLCGMRPDTTSLTYLPEATPLDSQTADAEGEWSAAHWHYNETTQTTTSQSANSLTKQVSNQQYFAVNAAEDSTRLLSWKKCNNKRNPTGAVNFQFGTKRRLTELCAKYCGVFTAQIRVAL